ELYEALASAGLIGLGNEASTTAPPDPRLEVAVLEELGAGPTSMAVCLVVQYMGMGLLAQYASVAQRRDILTPLAEGCSRIAFALTEPDGGTDVAAAMRTRAKRGSDGSWSLSGAKTWISGPLVADHLIVLARTAEPAVSSIDGITMFLVPQGASGVRINELDTFAIHGLDTCLVEFDDVRLPAHAVLGEVGLGFRQVLSTLNGERLNAAAVALGIARGALDAAARYARERVAFGRPIASFQAQQVRLVDCAIQIESARALLDRAATAAAEGKRADTLSAMAKVAASEAAVAATDTGMRVMAGAGFSTEFAMERFFRDARLYTFAPLTNDMLRNYLGEKHLGLPRCF
ncbi:acyl-CoA dehydrogenase family protein, partial [Gordonia rhizosphera]